MRAITGQATGGQAITAVGIGTAGPLAVTGGLVSPVNIPAWRDFPLVDTVKDLIPGVPVALAGDAQCMALGEWWRGVRLPAEHTLLGVVVSTGIGGGLVIDGVPWLGPTGNAGHIGHITVDQSGDRCPCGLVGCVETVASGPSMVLWAHRQGWRAKQQRPDARLLAADALAGVPIAVAAFARGADALATALVTAAALCDIDHVVIGGGVAAAGATLLDPLRSAVRQRAGLPFTRRLRITVTTLGRDAGLFGAAALALRAGTSLQTPASFATSAADPRPTGTYAIT